MNAKDLEAGKGWIMNRNITAISLETAGSDLYGVLEKTAFHLSLLRTGKTDTENWFDAQRAMGEWMTSEAYMKECGDDIVPAFSITEFLNKRAEDLFYLHRKINSCFRWCEQHLRHPDDHFLNWIHTQDKLGEAIAKSYVEGFEKVYDLPWGRWASKKAA